MPRRISPSQNRSEGEAASSQRCVLLLLSPATLGCIFQYLSLKEAASTSALCRSLTDAFQSEAFWEILLQNIYFVRYLNEEYQPLPLSVTLPPSYVTNDDWTTLEWFTYVQQSGTVQGQHERVLAQHQRFEQTRLMLAKKMKYRNRGVGIGGIFFHRTAKDVFAMIHRRTFMEKRFHELTKIQRAGVIAMTVALSPILFVYNIPRMARWAAAPLSETVTDIDNFIDEYLKPDRVQGEPLLTAPGVPPTAVSFWTRLRRGYGRVLAVFAAPYVMWRIGRRRAWRVLMKHLQKKPTLTDRIKDMLTTNTRVVSLWVASWVRTVCVACRFVWTHVVMDLFWRPTVATYRAVTVHVVKPAWRLLCYGYDVACRTVGFLQHRVLKPTGRAAVRFLSVVRCRTLTVGSLAVLRCTEFACELGSFTKEATLVPCYEAGCTTAKLALFACRQCHSHLVLPACHVMMHTARAAQERACWLGVRAKDAACCAARRLLEDVVMPSADAVEVACTALCTEVLVPLWNFLVYAVLVPRARDAVNAACRAIVALCAACIFLWRRALLPLFKFLRRVVMACWRGANLAARLFYWQVVYPLGSLAGRTYRNLTSAVGSFARTVVVVGKAVGTPLVRACAAAVTAVQRGRYLAAAFFRDRVARPLTVAVGRFYRAMIAAIASAARAAVVVGKAVGTPILRGCAAAASAFQRGGYLAATLFRNRVARPLAVAAGRLYRAIVVEALRIVAFLSAVARRSWELACLVQQTFLSQVVLPPRRFLADAATAVAFWCRVAMRSATGTAQRGWSETRELLLLCREEATRQWIFCRDSCYQLANFISSFFGNCPSR